MAVKRTRILEYSVPAQAVFDAALAAAAALAESPPAVQGVTVTAATKTTWLSFGENLSLTVEAIGPSTRVTMQSASSMPTQFIDWGVHRKNLNAMQASVTQSLGAEPAVTQAG